MARKGHRASRHGRVLTGMLALLLVSGCEHVRTPVGPSPGVAEAFAPIPVTTVVGRSARLAWTRGLENELDHVRRQMRSAPVPNEEMMRRAEGLEKEIAEASGPAESVSPSAADAADDAGIASFGTQIRVPYGGPIAVTAFTEATRATHISHVMRIRKTTAGRTYSSTIRDDSGFLNQPALYTTVELSGDCTILTTVDAQTEHRAGSLTYRNQYAVSDANASCGLPAEPCEDGEGDKGGELVQSAGAGDASPSSDCTGGGGGPGGETTPNTCYTITTDHYWYYPDTNTYEFRYSEESTWCEENTA